MSTPIFRLLVYPSNIDNEAIESLDEFTALQKSLQELEAIKKTVQKGEKGDRSTIKVGKVTTSDPGGEAKVTNSGTNTDAIFDFAIRGAPRGQRANQAGMQQIQILTIQQQVWA